MMKLYHKGTVHPSPTLSNSSLPATILALALATALSAEDKEVLAYLLSISFHFNPYKSHHHHHHYHSFNCYCFSCYTIFWARWDSSPNRHLIHEIIDAFEDGLIRKKKKKRKKQGLTKKEKRKNNNNDHNNGLDLNLDRNIIGFDGSSRVNPELGQSRLGEITGGHLGNGDDETGDKQGTIRKIMSSLGERIWGSVLG